MKQNERIAWYVLRGEIIDSEQLDYTIQELCGPPDVISKAEKAEWLLTHYSPATLHEYFGFEYVRICEHCGKPMVWGYVADGCRTYCSDECLRHYYTEEEWREKYANGNSDSYYTSWID